jgi:hypothetical protein
MSIRTLRAVTPAQLLQALQERRDAGLTVWSVCGPVHEHTDPPQPIPLLPPRRERQGA